MNKLNRDRCLKEHIINKAKWYSYGAILNSSIYAFCTEHNVCFYWASYDPPDVFDFNDMPKAITKVNYIGYYISWCYKNNYAPLAYDVLMEIFYGCETNEEYEDTANALFKIQDEGFKLSFMQQTKKDSLEALEIRLKIRLELFARVPSATNMLLAYNLIEEITLKKYSTNQAAFEDKLIERFDKLKNLALSSKFIPERKLAFERSLEIFSKLTQISVNGTK